MIRRTGREIYSYFPHTLSFDTCGSRYNVHVGENRHIHFTDAVPLKLISFLLRVCFYVVFPLSVSLYTEKPQQALNLYCHPKYDAVRAFREICQDDLNKI